MNGFQFLLGTLKTAFPAAQEIRGLVFQFLLGTLKTVTVGPDLLPDEEVSIPLRYAKNSPGI